MVANPACYSEISMSTTPAEPPKTAISIRDVSVLFGGRFKALDGLSAELSAGQIVGVIGPSGAGKTTLIRAIVGRQRLSSGSVTVFGRPAGAKALRSRLSYMTQAVSVYGDLTVTENLRYFAIMAGVSRKEVALQVRTVLKAVDMTAQAGQIAERLSGGQRQRLSLAIALIGKPRLMVLDEPTVGLDPVLREQLWRLFRALAAHGITLIISSHVMDEAERCDQLLLIRDGALLASGSPRELCERTGSRTVEQSFLHLVGQAA